MDKKRIAEFIEDMVTEIAKTQKLEDNEARALIGITLKRNRDNIIAAASPPPTSAVHAA